MIQQLYICTCKIAKKRRVNVYYVKITWYLYGDIYLDNDNPIFNL